MNSRILHSFMFYAFDRKQNINIRKVPNLTILKNNSEINVSMFVSVCLFYQQIDSQHKLN